MLCHSTYLAAITLKSVSTFKAMPVSCVTGLDGRGSSALFPLLSAEFLRERIVEVQLNLVASAFRALAHIPWHVFEDRNYVIRHD